MHYAGVDLAHFQQWKEGIKDGYHMSNCYAVPKFLSKFGNCKVANIPQNITLSDMLVNQEIRNIYQLQSLHNMKNEVEELKIIVNRQHDEMMKMKNEIIHLLQQMSGNSKGVRDSLLLYNESVGNNEDVQEKDTIPLLSYDAIRDMCKNEVEVASKVRIFVIFEMQKAYDKLNPMQKAKEKSGFCKLKKGIDLVLNWLPEGVNLIVPSMEECDGDAGLRQWDFELSMQLQRTCCEMRNKLVEGNKIQENAKLSMNILQKHKEYLEGKC